MRAPIAFATAALIFALPCCDAKRPAETPTPPPPPAHAAAAPAPAAAQPVAAKPALADPLLLEQVPADAQLCFAWNVLEHPGYAGSAYEKFNTLSQRGPLTADAIEANLKATLAPMLKQAQLPPGWMEAFTATLAAASVHGGALYVHHFEINPQNGPMPPAVALLVRAPKEGPALLEAWTKTLSGQTKIPVLAECRDGLFRLSFNLMGPPEPWVAKDQSLATNPRFIASAAALGKDQAILAYADGTNLVERLKAFEAWEKAKKGHSDVDFAKLDAALGLSGLQALTFGGGFTADGQWQWNALIEASAPRRGVLAMMDGATLSPDLLKRVPASVESFSAAGFDLGKTIDAVLALVGAEEPDARAQWDKTLADLKAQTGIDIPASLAGLGDQWLIFSDPMATGGGLAGTVVVSPLRDGAAVENNLNKAATLGSAMLKQQLAKENSPFGLGFLTDTFRGVTIQRLGFPLLSPGYAVHDGTLYAALLPQAIQGAVRPVKQPLVDGPAYQKLYAQVVPADARLRLVGYADLGRLAPHCYDTGLMLHQWGLGATEMVTGQPASMQLPILADLMPVLSPSLTAAWTDAKGMHLRSQGPFPGSGLVVCGFDSTISVPTAALMAGIMVPVLAQARTTANVTKESVNARNVCVGAVVYATSNKDYYPGWTSRGQRMDGNLSGLTYMLRDGGIVPQQLLSVFGGQTRPCPAIDWAHATPADLKLADAWVRENSAVIFIGDLQRRKSDQDNTKLDAFVDPSKLPDPRKIPVVHGDSSSEIVSREELDFLLQAQCGADSATLVRLFRAGQMPPQTRPAQ